jgi:hypothetical protein
MKLRMIAAPLATLAIGAALAAAPMTASADGYHRNSDRGTWNGLALGAAALGIYGIASHQPGLAVLGLAGAGYSEYRASNDYRDRDWDRDRDYRVYRDRDDWGRRNVRRDDFRREDSRRDRRF